MKTLGKKKEFQFECFINPSLLLKRSHLKTTVERIALKKKKKAIFFKYSKKFCKT